jgi:hypothetical protein
MSRCRAEASRRRGTNTAADLPSHRYGATGLDALLPAFLDRTVKGEL